MQTIEQILLFIGNHIFLIFGLLATAGAVGMVASRSAVHSVVGFLLSMLSMAGCYLALEAEFLGVAQLLIYAGGIVVLFLFVVMLVELSRYKETTLFHKIQTPAAILVVLAGAALFLGIFRDTIFGAGSSQALVLRPDISEGLNVGHQNAEAISRALFADHLLPFEILSVILLVALVGALVLAKAERT